MTGSPSPTVTRTVRTSIADRAKQVATAVQVLRVRGTDEFGVADIANEIDHRLPSGSLHRAIDAFVALGIFTCVTPDKQRYRHYRVADWARLDALIAALDSDRREDVILSLITAASGEQTPPPVPMLKPEQVRSVRWFFPRFVSNRRLLQEVQRVSAKVDRLLEMWE
jgi:hypothetical protein